MLSTIPSYISITFILTTLLTLYLFYRIINEVSTSQSKIIITLLSLWLIIQGGIAYKELYASTLDAFPPRFLFAVLPTLLIIAFVFFSKNGKIFIEKLSLTKITWLNIVRIPVEVVLYWLFLSKVVPELMTFSGRNFDILAGITAPIIAYLGFTKKSIGNSLLLTWNMISLCLLLFIVANAILSAPLPIQQFGFDQPNIALFYFPFIWLPSFIVPIVIFGHLVSIRQLLNPK